MVSAEVTTSTMARMKRLVQPQEVPAGSPVKMFDISDGIEGNTGRNDCDNQKEEGSKPVDGKREGEQCKRLVYGKCRDFSPRRIRTETLPRKTEASMVQDDESVLAIFKIQVIQSRAG